MLQIRALIGGECKAPGIGNAAFAFEQPADTEDLAAADHKSRNPAKGRTWTGQ
jgi:hypothetical protein